MLSIKSLFSFLLVLLTLFIAPGASAQVRQAILGGDVRYAVMSEPTMPSMLVEIKGKKGPKAKTKSTKPRPKLRRSLGTNRLRSNRVVEKSRVGRSGRLNSPNSSVAALKSIAGEKVKRHTVKTNARPSSRKYWNSVKLNQSFLKKNPGNKPPHDPYRPSKTVTTNKPHELVRVLSLNAGVHTNVGVSKEGKAKNSLSEWAITKTQFKRLQRGYQKTGRHQYRTLGAYIKDKLALPGNPPSHFIQIHVPKGSKISVSYAGRQVGWGRGGHPQVMLHRTPSWSEVSKPLPL